MIKRCHDLDKSGHWVWLIIVPFVNIGLFLYLLFAAGSDEPNRFDYDALSRSPA